MESTAITAGWHNPRLQQMRTSTNAAALDAEMKEENLLTFGRLPAGRDLQQKPLASIAKPKMRSGKGWILASPVLVTQEHCMHLSSCVGPAFHQVFNHCFKL